MSIEAMKQVKQELEHIKQYGYATDIDHAIKTLGQAIVEAQTPEPVSWAETNDMVCALLKQAHDVLACASYPFKRPWVGLTDDEAHKIIDDCTPDEAEIEELIDFSIAILAVEAKLKERNNG
jgi:hypothetical protein